MGYPTGLCDHVAIQLPNDLAGMQFSTAFSLALTVTKGRNSPREYALDALADAEINEMAAKIHVKEDKELTETCRGHFPAWVKITSKFGHRFQCVVVDAKGSALSPMSSAEIDDKFSYQAGDIIGKEKCRRLLQAVRNIDKLNDVAEIPKMLIV